MELFHNLLHEEMTVEQSGQTSSDIPTAIFVRHALKTPYLMHELLAISALHMGIRSIDSGSQRSYQTYSTGLQNRALQLFHEDHPNLEVTRSNAAQMFLFSSLVGIHLLTDTLYQKISLVQTIQDFTRSLDVSRGAMTVIHQLPRLQCDPELGPGFRLSNVIQAAAVESQNECEDLKARIMAANIPASTLQVYLETIEYVQQAFDASHGGSRITAIFAWLVKVEAPFVELLRQHQPEALVILSYYAILLHQSRNFWVVNQGGQFLIESISQALGEQWQDWMAGPMAAIQMHGT